MPASTSESTTAKTNAASSKKKEAAAMPAPTILSPADAMQAWWAPQWEMHNSLSKSYWDAWQTMAWMPWNMVLSAWQMADAHAAHTAHLPRGLLQSSMGQIDLDKAQ